MPKHIVYHLVVLSLLFLLLQFAQEWLLFKRTEILDGEWWRLFTANLVHTNFTHLGLNLLGLWILAYFFVEHWSKAIFYSALILLSLGVGMGIFLFSPKTEWYAGLSGALYGLFIVMSLVSIYRKDYWTGIPVFVLIVGKLIWDETSGDLSQASVELIGAPVLTISHVIGACSALFYCFGLWVYGHLREK